MQQSTRLVIIASLVSPIAASLGLGIIILDPVVLVVATIFSYAGVVSCLIPAWIIFRKTATTSLFAYLTVGIVGGWGFILSMRGNEVLNSLMLLFAVTVSLIFWLIAIKSASVQSAQNTPMNNSFKVRIKHLFRNVWFYIFATILITSTSIFLIEHIKKQSPILKLQLLKRIEKKDGYLLYYTSIPENSDQGTWYLVWRNKKGLVWNETKKIEFQTGKVFKMQEQYFHKHLLDYKKATISGDIENAFNINDYQCYLNLDTYNIQSENSSHGCSRHPVSPYGFRYDGFFVDNKLIGYGMEYTLELHYRGFFKNGKKHGRGVCVNSIKYSRIRASLCYWNMGKRIGSRDG